MTAFLTETNEVLETVMEMTFFANTGQSNSHPSVNNWQEAIDCFRKTLWSELFDEQRHRITSSTDSDPNWNEKVRQLRTIVRTRMEFEKRRLIENGIDSNAAAWICDELASQLLGVCVETESSHWHNVHFFRGLWSWIKQGRFPCGWTGDYPEGTLIVF